MRTRFGIGAVLVLVIGLWVAVAGIGGQKIGQLSSVQTNDAASYLPTGAESVRAAEVAAQFDSGNALPAFVVFSAPQVASPEQLRNWSEFAARVPSVGFTGDSGATAVVGDYLAGPVIPVGSEDGRATLLVVNLDLAKVTAMTEAGESVLPAIVDALRGAAATADAGGSSHVAGPAGLAADLVEAFTGIDGLLLLVALGVVLVILLLVYRALVLPLMVLSSSVCCLALAGWLVYLLADAGSITLSGQSQGILFILVIGAATDYGLLLTARYREELTGTEDAVTAIRRAWRACLAPIAASAGTVIAGLLCLLLSDLNSNSSLGPIGAIGIGAAFVGSLTLLPAMLATGRWMFWPRRPRVEVAGTDIGAGGEDADARAEREARHHRVWGAVAAMVGRHPRRVWVVTAIALLAMCAGLPTFKASGTKQTDVFLGGADSVAGQAALEEHYPGGTGSPVVVIVPERAADRVGAAIADVPGITGRPVVHGEPGGPAKVVDGNVQLRATLAAASDSAEAKSTVRQVREVVHGMDLDGTVLVGGTTAEQVDTADTSDRDLRVIIPSILLSVLLILMALLRSIVAPLVLVAATVLSFGSALGVSALVFNHLFDFPGADPAVPLFAFVFLVALGVDYSIFLMSRAREEALRVGPTRGIATALVSTGGVITSAGVVLAATFAALGVLPILFLAQIAFIVAFGVLLDTLVVRTLLVPGIAEDLGRRVWWPSGLGAPTPPDRRPRSSSRRADAGRSGGVGAPP
ncbi:MMPL family transporter [Pseudonocardia asaccharolytica]|uniref:Membrane protein n=1 Tax=Pseudonocardia asaccharolytica DSM 44247 = NBRC 16224 TaxID=1123024 RepID=A0A511D1V7_9PSEU|nr:MMPL family transporter [Pseudonocardia asaccharolytica]GEL18769.1 membrane protein [Pseudonocardia asaccharolytica DSM 44247 = NBRC 16224]